MSTNKSVSDVLKALHITDGTEVENVIHSALAAAAHFTKENSTLEFDFDALCTQFKTYCEDFDEVLTENVESKALQFSGNMLFEFGPMLGKEMKDRRRGGDKAVRFNFPYKKTNAEGVQELAVRTVFIRTFKENPHVSFNFEEVDANGTKLGIMTLSVKQATLLATKTFLTAIDYEITAESGLILMTPLCGAIFSKEGIADIAIKLDKEAAAILKTMNASTCPEGHYLAESDMACAVVATIAGTKWLQSKGTRYQMIAKVIKQYSAKKKEFNPIAFEAYAKHAFIGVPPGLDDIGSLIDEFNKIQASTRK